MASDRDPESPFSDKTGALDPGRAPGAPADPGPTFGRYRDLQLLGSGGRPKRSWLREGPVLLPRGR
jgi:hypothetical protein